MTSSQIRPGVSALVWREWLFLGLVILGWALFAVALGKNTSWDFRNYHWYIPYAFLHGRMGFDIAVAHQATYYNPLVDIPFYLAAKHLPSWLALGLLGAVQGANAVPLYLIARTLLRVEPRRPIAAVLTAFSMTGGLTLGLIGTTYYDNVMSVFVLSGLALLIARRQTLTNGPPRHAAAIAAIAGFVVGSAVGLKLPEAPYALGFAAALAVVPATAKRRSLLLAAGGIGGVAGTAVFFGYWIVHMLHVTGNPLFPYFNEIFHSPLVIDFSFRDARFLQDSLWNALSYPFRFSLDWQVADDLPFTDIRIGLAYGLLIVSATWWLLRRRAREPLTGAEGTRILFAFAVVSYVAWLAVFGIYRYILSLEMLAPVVIVAAVGGWPLARRTRLVILAALALAVAATTRADFLARAPLGDPYVQVTMPKIARPAQTMILMTGIEPMGFLVPELPPEIPVLRIDGWLITPDDGSKLTGEARTRIAAFKGDLDLIAAGWEMGRTDRALAAYGLAIAHRGCADIKTNLGGPYLFCRLVRKTNARP